MSLIKQYRADVAMLVIVVVWGFHFVVVKDALATVPPLVFQAIRFSIGAPVFLMIVYRLNYLPRLWMTRADFLYTLFFSVLGPLGYQLFFIFGLQLTTSTNTSLLIATTPMWTALFSILARKLQPKRMLFVWTGVTLVGVTLVVLGRGGGLAFSGRDAWGSGLALAGAFVYALYSLMSKPIVDKYGALSLAIWTHWLTCVGLIIVAIPQLLTVTAADVPVSAVPQIFYSGVLAGVGGYLVWNYALQEIGPARASLYNNLTPLFSAMGGALFLSEALTRWILLGAALILVGVAMVRNNMQATST